MEQYALVSARDGLEVGFLGEAPTRFESTDIINYGNYVPLNKPFVRAITSRLSAFFAAVKDFQPDIIHVRYHIGCWLLPIIAKHLKKDVRVILDIRTLATSERKHKLARMSRYLNALGYDHVFGLNQKILDEYVRGSVTSSILPLGYNPETFYPKTEYTEPKTKLVRCVYFGSLARQRNLGTLIKAIVKAIDAGVPIGVDFIGGGDDESYLRSIVPKRHKDRIVFLGFIEQSNLAAQLHEYELGISYVPITEIFDPNVPLKTVEMLACGLPVLATNTSGNRSLIKDNETGFLTSDQEDSLVGGLRHAVNELPCMHLNRQRISESVSEFSWPTLAKKYLYTSYEV
jgi:glycosyltransferase involved in cell wall biosynthesis